jgi:hypothetical protein
VTTREDTWTSPAAVRVMTSEEHRVEAIELYHSAQGFQTHQAQHTSRLQRAQWHATMALVEQCREGLTP